MWQQMFGFEAELDLEAMYRAYLDMMLPEKERGLPLAEGRRPGR